MKTKKKASFKPLIYVMVFSLLLAFLWDKIFFIKNFVEIILWPVGLLLNWNLSLGMIIVIFLITLITTLIQKYATDQEALREIKKEQKEIQKQMKEFREHPEKIKELSKKQMSLMPKQMKLSMRAIIYTGIPLILLFKWFQYFFSTIGEFKFIGFIGSWFLFYIILSLIFGAILRKLLKVV